MNRAADIVAVERLRSRLDEPSRLRIERFERYAELSSTNDHLLESAPPAPGRANVCVADLQTAGRGRRGRAWMTPPGSGLCLSVGWSYPTIPQPLASLSLAAGVGVVDALAGVGVTDLGLKWPNDVLRRGCKLGGILAEVRTAIEGRVHVVVGVGINIRLPPDFAQAVQASGGQLPIDLSDSASITADPDALTACLIASLVQVFEGFGREGFTPFRDAWHARDVLAGRSVDVHAADVVRRGVVQGLSPEGFLRVLFPEGVQSVVAGDVSLRVVE